MKKIGVIILAIGLLLTLFTGFNLITREKLIDIGTVEVTYNRMHNFYWSPLAGIAAMAIGLCLYLFGRTNKSLQISK
jgi:hypothetical protein